MHKGVEKARMNMSTTGGFCGGQEFWNASLLFSNWYPAFTECFQDTAFTYGACGYLWLTSITLLLYLKHHRQFVLLPTTWLALVRLMCALAVSLLSALHVLVPFDNTASMDSPPPSFFVAKALWAFTFVYAAALMLAARRRGLATPCVLFIFWLLATVVHVVPIYTLALQEDFESRMLDFSLSCCVFGLLLLQLALQGVGEATFQMVQPSTTGKYSPYVGSSYISRLVFSWCFPLVYKGFKTIVVVSDMLDLPSGLQCRNIVPEFLYSWAKHRRQLALSSNSTSKGISSRRRKEDGEKEPSETTRLLPRQKKEDEEERPGDEEVQVRRGRRKQPSLYKVLAKMFYLHLFKCQLVGLMADLLLFLNPVLLQQLISYVEDKSAYPVWQGYFLAASFFVVVFLNSVMTNYRFFNSWNIGVQVKTVLSAAVYKKSLTMNAESRRLFTVGTTVNLMAVDCVRFQDFTTNLYVLVSWPFQMSIALYMLYNTLGTAFVLAIVVLVILLPITVKSSTLARKAQAVQITIKDQRIKLMNEVLSGIKVLKLYAWEPSFETKIVDLRRQEVGQLKRAAVFQSINTIAMLTTPVMLVLTTFIAYVVITGQSLTPDKAFVAMSILNNIKNPMNSLPMLVSSAIQCNVSMKRLRDYLSGEDLEDRDVTTATHEHPVMMQNGTFLWDRTMAPVLNNVSLTVPRGSLVAIVGQVGAGKSSLLSAFLGEMEKLHGFGSIKGSIGYVPQQAWVQNMSLRANILFEQAMEDKWYRETIAACALEPDIELLPGGEMTEIGEKGINLSGGQKQRVSLARAVYQRADVYLLDDPLSAVDAHVGKHIFEKVIGAQGMLKDKTRLLVTHGLHWLPLVDSIVVMDRGYITEAGTYKELMSHNGPFAEFLRTYLLEHEDEDFDDPEVQEWKAKVLEEVDSLSEDESSRSLLRK